MLLHQCIRGRLPLVCQEGRLRLGIHQLILLRVDLRVLRVHIDGRDRRRCGERSERDGHHVQHRSFVCLYPRLRRALRDLRPEAFTSQATAA